MPATHGPTQGSCCNAYQSCPTDRQRRESPGEPLVGLRVQNHARGKQHDADAEQVQTPCARSRSARRTGSRAAAHRGRSTDRGLDCGFSRSGSGAIAKTHADGGHAANLTAIRVREALVMQRHGRAVESVPESVPIVGARQFTRCTNIALFNPRMGLDPPARVPVRI